MKAVYKKLLKIKNPVLIEAITIYGDRYRILYPDGKCEYAQIIGFSFLHRSCFQDLTLVATVEAMERYDKHNDLQVIKIQEIK